MREIFELTPMFLWKNRFFYITSPIYKQPETETDTSL